jgi:hypothetical protein
VSIPKTLTELESCEFDFEILDISSFAYQILCARNLGKFFRSQPIAGPDDPALSRTEALLAHWRLYLPASKRDAIVTDGTVGEMMFQAHMMINADVHPHPLPSLTARLYDEQAHRFVRAGAAHPLGSDPQLTHSPRHSCR